MGRPEMKLDPASGPVAAFAAELRALRVRAGTPSYRTLSSVTHYSVTTLSQAAAGRTPPSLPVLRAFVAACGGDCAEWERRWRALTEQLDEAKLAPAGTVAATVAATVATVAPARRVRWRPSRLVLVAFVTGLAVALAGTLVVVGWPAGQQRRGAIQSAAGPGGVGAVDPVADGSDPNRAGCGPGAVTLIHVDVHFPAATPADELQLRYSSRCRAAWSRFVPASTWHPGDNVVVTVWTIRPADQATQSYAVPYGGETIIGNMLMTARGCIVVEVSMVQGTQASPVATTACQAIGG